MNIAGLRRLLLVALFSVASTTVSGVVHAATTTPLLRIAGGTAGGDLGDFVSDEGDLNTHYTYYVEVPAGTTRLTIDIFDADFGDGGDNDTNNDRDRERGTSFNSTTTYRVFNPAGGAVTTNFTNGTATGPNGADNAWLTLYTVTNPAAGHWRIELDSADTTGDDVNAYGLRAHDGTAGAGGRELNVYAHTAMMMGVNAVVGSGTRGTTFTLYPYVTAGCTANHKDFDYDNDDALVVGGIPQRAVYTNRNDDWSQTIANASLSDNDAWNTDVLTTTGGVQPSGTNVVRDGMGIWRAEYRINEFAGDNANYSTIYLGDDTLTGTPPTANPQTSAMRIYLPTDASAAPLKPYLRQSLSIVSGANPPVVGQVTVMQVSVNVINPTAYPIVFSATNTVTARVPTVGGVTYVNPSALVSQGTVTGQPANNGNGLVTWNPGTVAANTTAQLRYHVRVVPTGGGTFNVTGAGNLLTNSNEHGTKAQFLDETGASTQAQATYRFGGLCPLQYTTTVLVPTPVTVSWVSATRNGNALDIAWTTDSEYRNVAFDVYGRNGTQWRRLTTRPQPSRGDSLGARAYALHIADAADIDAVAIEDIAADGRRTRHPGVAIGEALGKRATPDSIDWFAIRAEARAAARNSGGDAASAWLTVERDGIHRVTAAQLLAVGVDLRATPREQLALTNAEGPVAMRVTGGDGATFGDDGAIEFFGTASRSLYGAAHVYTLSANVLAARRVRDIVGNAAGTSAFEASYGAEVLRAQDNAYSFASPSADPWYDTRMLAFDGAPQSYTFTLALDAFAATQSGNSVALSLWGGSDWPEIENDHRFDIAVNGTPVTAYAFPGLRDELLRFALPDGLLHAGNNTVTITQTADVGAAHDLVHLERVALSYRRAYVARDGALDTGDGPAGEAAIVSDTLFRDGYGDDADACATTTCASIEATGFAQGALAAWLVAGDDVARIADAHADARGRATLVLPRASGERLYAINANAIATPVIRSAAPATDPALPAAQLLVIAHPQFAGALGAFVGAREAQGFSVRVVDVDRAYARYSAGQRDPEAIRALLRDAYAHGTRYALLVGADTYDYHDHAGLGAMSFVPTLYAPTGDIVRYAPADTLFGDLDGDDLPEIAVGRWPVRTQAELDRLIAKTLAYDSAPDVAEALLVAGGSQPDFDFSALNATLDGTLAAAGWQRATANIDALGVNAARDALVVAINDGRALVNFVGHSSVDRWTFDPLLLGSDVATLFGNAGAPTVVAQWGCWSNYFVNPASDGIAVRLLLDDGGAAAAIGATTLVDTEQQDAFMHAFVAAAANGATLGDALNAARRDFGSGHAQRRDLTVGINLLGDPTLKLRRD
jgi:hypothetical protein